jgi:uncharacterized protein YdgA (DUF945 family)
MPHVSPKKVDENILKEALSFFFSAIAEKDMSQKQQRNAFNELFTRTEKIMLGKRLTAISMIYNGIGSYEVSKKLCLSPTTTAKLQLKIERGEFRNIKKLCDIINKGPLGRYIDNLLKPLPRYGTGPQQLFKKK